MTDRELTVDDYVTAAARGLSRAMVETAARGLPEHEREELRMRLDALTTAPPTVPMRLPATDVTVTLDLPQPVAPLVRRHVTGRLSVEWPEGRGVTAVAPEVVEGWAQQVNRLLDLAYKVIDYAAGLGLQEEDDTIRSPLSETIDEFRREAAQS